MDVHRTKPQRSREVRAARLFTLESANRTLPLLSRIVRDVVTVYGRVRELEASLHAAATDGRIDSLAGLRAEHDEQLESLRGLAEEVDSIGCELKDGEKGLVDFRAMLDGREVYLCWRLGEERIEHWHELEAGFGGRRRIPSGT